MGDRGGGNFILGDRAAAPSWLLSEAASLCSTQEGLWPGLWSIYLFSVLFPPVVQELG